MMTGKRAVWLAALMMLPLAGGCGSRFAGEWVQAQAIDRDGLVTPVSGERRTAFQFIPPSTVRVGFYSDSAKAVEAESVSSSDYQTIQNRSVAEFGAYTARVENGQLLTFIGSKPVGRFERLSGKSVFPPLVALPQFVNAESSTAAPDMPAVAVSD